MSRLLNLSALLLILFVGAAAGQDDNTKLESIKYADLGKLVRSYKGKPVVVYFWAHYCQPCKQEGIPHLVKMHEKYGKEGLVILTVTLDENTDKDTTAEDRAGWRKGIQKYLVNSKLPFRTYDLDFDPSKTPTALKFGDGGVPRVFVFNRDNQYVFREIGPDKAVLEKAITEAVKKK